MNAVERAVQSAIERWSLTGQRALVGVSGGTDSVALLRAFAMLRKACGVDLVACHVNHQWRGALGDEDERWTLDLARSLDVPAIAVRVNAPERAAQPGSTIEEAARELRYRALEQTAIEQSCSAIAVAHTADDQVETVLHHLLRGTGLAGLRGIPACRELSSGARLVRPLLDVRRTQIETWLAEIGQAFRVDHTNADTARTRNRIRHRLIPILEQEFGPQVHASILRLAAQADDAQAAIELLACRLLDDSLRDASPDCCRLDVARLADQPVHLVREAFVQLWRRQGWPRQAMGYAEWMRLCGLVTGEGSITLPGAIQAARRGRLIVLEAASSDRSSPSEKP